MPGGDRTGPAGMGPMSGRRMGYCTGYDHPGFSAQNFGLRSFRGGVTWWGNRRRWFNHPGYPNENISPELDKEIIENEISILKNQLAVLEKKLNSINKEE